MDKSRKIFKLKNNQTKLLFGLRVPIKVYNSYIKNTHRTLKNLGEIPINMPKDKFESLKFHIESQDYFGTLATVLGLCRQENKSIPEHIIDDLIYLQKNYKINEIEAPDADVTFG